MTDAEFAEFVISRGLFAVASTETLDAFRRRYGVRSWYEFRDVIDLPAASLFPEQTERFFFETNSTCLLPPAEFECDFDAEKDARKTYQLALTIRTFLNERTRGPMGWHSCGRVVGSFW